MSSIIIIYITSIHVAKNIFFKCLQENSTKTIQNIACFEFLTPGRAALRQVESFFCLHRGINLAFITQNTIGGISLLQNVEDYPDIQTVYGNMKLNFKDW